jgi:hypothetical protein
MQSYRAALTAPRIYFAAYSILQEKRQKINMRHIWKPIPASKVVPHEEGAGNNEEHGSKLNLYKQDLKRRNRCGKSTKITLIGAIPMKNFSSTYSTRKNHLWCTRLYSN